MSGEALSEVPIEVGMAADPEPVNRVPVAATHRAMREINPGRPKARIALERVEMKTWMERILMEPAVCLSCLSLDFRRQRIVHPPEAGKRS
jgi:hypothetical protein